MADTGEPSAGSPARRGRPGYDQETVLRRAIDLFNRKGYDATSMGDLADELGLTKSAIYHHVPSKEHLLAAALDEALDGLARVVETPVTGSAYDHLRLVVHESVAILVAHLPAVTLLLRVRGNSEVELAALGRRRAIDTAFARLVEQAVTEGTLRSDVPPELASKLLFGTVNSLVEWLRPDGGYDATALADAVTTLVFDGLRGQPS